MDGSVSILIPCFNAERWVAEAIKSALAQSWPEKEVIVVDDGSTDRSLKIIQSFGDKILWETGPNRGGNVARNRLLELARAEWLQYLDADDYLLPGKLAQQMEFITDCPNADVVYSPVTVEHWRDQPSESTNHSAQSNETNSGISSLQLLSIPEPHDPWVLLARWFLPPTGAPLWRKQAVIDVGGWKPDQPCGQELELYLRLLMAGKKFAYCPGRGAVHRHWSEHTVSTRDKPGTRRRRLEMQQRAEEFLRAGGKLTPARHRAINQGRFEMARIAWQHDRAEARQIIATVRDSDPGFLPRGLATPPVYRLMVRLLGFCAAETVADWGAD